MWQMSPLLVFDANGYLNDLRVLSEPNCPIIWEHVGFLYEIEVFKLI